MCIPLDSFWKRLKPGKCYDGNIYIFVVGIFDGLLDMVIVVLPMRMVSKLHMARSTKAALISIFLLAGVYV